MFCVFWSFSQNAGNQLCFRFWGQGIWLCLPIIHCTETYYTSPWPLPCDPPSLSPPLLPLFFIPSSVTPLLYPLLYDPSLSPPLWPLFFIPSSMTPPLWPLFFIPSPVTPPLWPPFCIPSPVTPLLYPLLCDPSSLSPPLWPLPCDPSSLSPPLWPLFFIPSSVTPPLHTPWRDCWGPQWWLWLSWDSSQDSVSENRHNIISHLFPGLCHCTKIIYQYTLSQH